MTPDCGWGLTSSHSEAGEQLEAKIRSLRDDGSDIYFVGRGAKTSEHRPEAQGEKGSGHCSFAEPECDARPGLGGVRRRGMGPRTRGARAARGDSGGGRGSTSRSKRRRSCSRTNCSILFTVE